MQILLKVIPFLCVYNAIKDFVFKYKTDVIPNKVILQFSDSCKLLLLRISRINRYRIQNLQF